MTYDNVKSYKKPAFQPLFRRYIFRKTTGGVVLGLNQFCCNALLRRPINLFEKDSHQHNLSSGCLQLYQQNCLNILPRNVCFPKQVKN